MCLGSGSSKPALAQRTLPAEGTRPADESAKRTDKSAQPKQIEFGDPNKTNPKAYEDSYIGTMTNIHRQAKASTKDPGINL